MQKPRRRPWVVIVSLALAASGCASGKRWEGRRMFEVFVQEPERVERIYARSLREHADEPDEQVVDLVDTPVATRDNIRAARDRTVAEFAKLMEERAGARRELKLESTGTNGAGAGGGAGGPPPPPGSLGGLGILGVFKADPGGASALQLATPQCLTTFCAGVATVSLNPPPPPLPPLPGCFALQALSGPSDPPLAGYFGRLRKNCFGLALRLGFRKQFYAHVFKDHVPAVGDPDINAKALVMRAQNGETFYWAKTDLIGAFQDLRSTVLKKLHDQSVTDIGDENFLLHGTHTHSGLGAISPRWFPMIATVDLFDREVYEWVADRIVQAILLARANYGPAKLGSGTTTVDHVVRNRRKVCKADNHADNSKPDPTVGILRIDRASNDAPLATVFNFAIHGTSLPENNRLLHPDNMGYAERYIEQNWGGTALFFNGTEGDVGPVGHPADIGCALGCKVVEELQSGSIPTTAVVGLGSTFCRLNDPHDPLLVPACNHKLEQIQFRPLMFIESFDSARKGCFLDDGTSDKVIKIPKHKDQPLMDRQGAVLAAYGIETDVNGFIKNTVILTLPGEPITDIGTEIRNGVIGPDHVWVFGLSNAHMGYIVTEDEYEQGGYESGANFFGPTQGDVFTNIAVDLALALP